MYNLLLKNNIKKQGKTMKSFMLKLFMFASILFLGGCSVDGTVKDENGNILEQAQVTAIYDGGTQTTFTDVNGQYIINDLDHSGTVSVTVTKDGFIEQTQSAELSSSGVNLNFTLLPDTIIPPATITVRGVVKEVTGSVLEGVTIRSSLENVTTNEKGEYAISASLTDRISITATLANYAQNSRNVLVSEGDTSFLDITLTKIDKRVVFDVSTGANIFIKGANIIFDGGYIVNLDDSPYTGDVTAKVSVNQASSLVGESIIPGEYIGLQANGSETGLISYGFIDVTLEDSNEEPLRLADGLTATLTYPMDTNIIDTPATLPLWYYDTQKGIWIEDGFATFDVNTNSYTAEVSHFTTWNLASTFESASFSGCIEDSAGNTITDAYVNVSLPGYTGRFKNTDITGDFTISGVPAGQLISVNAYMGTQFSSAETFTLVPGETKQLTQCLVLDQDSSTSSITTSIKGYILNSDGTPPQGRGNITDSAGKSIGNFAIDTGTGAITFASSFLIPEDGIISIRLNLTNSSGSELVLTKYFSLDFTSTVQDLGTLIFGATTIQGCVQRADGSTLFDLIDMTEGSLSGPYMNAFASDNGIFNFIIEQDFLNHTYFIQADPTPKTVSFTINASQSIIDLGSNCLILQ